MTNMIFKREIRHSIYEKTNKNYISSSKAETIILMSIHFPTSLHICQQVTISLDDNK